jgi:periplasmic copper chaperone A
LVRRIAIVLGTAAILVLVMALPAGAHVSIQPSEATKGGFATLAFQVPNEKSDAKTVGVEVKFPDDPPIAEVSVQPIPNWSVKINPAPLSPPVTTDEGTTLSERVDTITWTAAAGRGLGEGEFQQFLVSMGLPDADTLQFPTIQTYDNGDKVSWIQQTPAGGPEPENPVPELKLVAGESDHGGGTTATTAPAGNGGTAAAVSNVKDVKDDADNAKTISIIALIIGILGVIFGVVAFVMGRRRPA